MVVFEWAYYAMSCTSAQMISGCLRMDSRTGSTDARGYTHWITRCFQKSPDHALSRDDQITLWKPPTPVHALESPDHALELPDHPNPVLESPDHPTRSCSGDTTEKSQHQQQIQHLEILSQDFQNLQISESSRRDVPAIAP